MPIADSPQLVEGMRARLDLGDRSLPCRIIGFSGSDVVIALDATPLEAPRLGADGYLLLESDGRLNALRGQVAAPAGAELVLRLSDDIRLQRRVFSRAPIVLPATLQGTRTVTRDVSAGGLRVTRNGIDPGAGTLALALSVSDHVVEADVSVRRATADELGLRFERIERDDRLLLAALALAYHRRG